MRKTLSIALILLIALGSFSMVAAQQNDEPIVVGSKDFTENQILGYIIYLTLQANNYEVEDRINLGGTAVNRDALKAGEISVYPEYTGTGLLVHLPSDLEDFSAPEGVANDTVASYGTVSALDALANDLIWLPPAPANNVYAFAVMRSFAEENDIYSVADLAEYVNQGGEVVVASNDEFAQRPDGIQSFEETYGFELSEDQVLVQAGAIPAQTLQALNEGANNVNVGMTYGTSGPLVAYDMVVLEDPDNAQPIYAFTPVFRGEVIRNNPEIVSILTPVFQSLDNDTMQTLNAAVDVDGENARDVAERWLTENGFLG
jgi:osmoprotectant transport system substrate-binding protein